MHRVNEAAVKYRRRVDVAEVYVTQGQTTVSDGAVEGGCRVPCRPPGEGVGITLHCPPPISPWLSVS